MKAILDLEDAAPDELLEILPGATVPFWAHVRMQIFWQLSQQHTGSVAVASTSQWTRWAEAKRVARGFLPNRWDAVRRAKQHDVCFYVAGGTLSKEGDRARNWLVDDFAEATEGAMVVQVRPLPSALGNPTFRPTLSMESATARSRWRARGTSLRPETDRGMDVLLRAFARRLQQPEDAFVDIGRRTRRTELLRPFQTDELRRLLERMSPRIVFFDNGSYTYHGESVAAMKDFGAYVVEPQHGWIGPSHAAYNYGKVFEEASLRRALPDEVLTFGDYWSTSIRHPGRVTTIGKPHLERQAAKAREHRSSRVLVVSSRTDPERTDAYVTALRSALGSSWSIAFRPHPGERAETDRRYPLLSADTDITVDVEPDVYESLKESAVVIGEASTVLFEARAFGCQVIARDSAFADTVIGGLFGPRVTNAEETAARVTAIASTGAVEPVSDPTIWAPNSIATYKLWLADARRRVSQAV
ncbi:hypothetical protein [Microbacterium sp. CIAB417]|uniref:hypothetical protein n=1 Tax=Microbacterium sp. CIAB417 TaxID=2860287 RepID=UPI001FAC91FE|nr:hypothetical protein [Microbacterium sp. CIAB417]